MFSSFFFRGAAMVIAATMGVGIFALPYVVKESGWATSLFYLILVSFVIIQTHSWYWRVLKEAGGQRLLGLAGRHGGKVIFLIAFLAIVVGLLLVLLAYLVLASSFFNLIFPEQDRVIGVLVIWLFGSLPLLFGVRRFASLEAFGAIAIFSILIGFFFYALLRGGSFSNVPMATSELLLPFGPLLFALAGWTALEPTYETEERKKSGDGFRGVAWGTVLAGFFYIIFISSIFLLGSEISSDTVSGLASWFGWERILISFFGFFLVLNAYIPVAWEVHTALEKDLGMKQWAFVVPMAIPPILFFLGMNNFFLAVSLAGGLFLSLQYLCMIFVASKVLSFSRKEKLLAGAVSFVFFLAVLYSLFSFILR